MLLTERCLSHVQLLASPHRFSPKEPQKLKLSAQDHLHSSPRLSVAYPRGRLPYALPTTPAGVSSVPRELPALGKTRSEMTRAGLNPDNTSPGAEPSASPRPLTLGGRQPSPASPTPAEAGEPQPRCQAGPADLTHFPSGCAWAAPARPRPRRLSANFPRRPHVRPCCQAPHPHRGARPNNAHGHRSRPH